MGKRVKKHRARRYKGKLTMVHIERSLHENQGLEKWTKKRKKRKKLSKKVKK